MKYFFKGSLLRIKVQLKESKCDTMASRFVVMRNKIIIRSVNMTQYITLCIYNNQQYMSQIFLIFIT